MGLGEGHRLGFEVLFWQRELGAPRGLLARAAPRADPPGSPPLTPLCLAVSSGSVTVNADSTVQVLAEEAVTMDMLDLAVSSASPQPGGFAPRFSPCLRSFLCLQSTHRAPGLRLHPQLPPLMGIKGCSSLAGCGERKPSSREPLPRPHPCPGTDADLASPHPSSSREQLFPSRAW